jgi:MoaA/NifB/PqqE/SkfB family radical SAM enzyme
MGEGGRNYGEKGESERGSSALSRNGAGKRSFRVGAGKGGRLEVHPDAARKLGLEPGAELEFIFDGGRVEVRPNIHSLSRLYIEPTTRCNLNCATCIRNTWAEPLGDMELSVFDRLMTQLKRFPHIESVMFGGFGEPTVHPDILNMIAAVKGLGLRVEMVTNGTRLDDTMLAGLAKSGLDTLWVSFDGTSEACFEGIREGADYGRVVSSLKRLRELNANGPRGIEVGISFVVMKRNIEDLRRIDRLIEAVGASRVSVSNVLPYSADMEREMVCGLAVSLETFSAVPGKAEISLPRLDINNLTKDAIFELLRGYDNLTLMGNPVRTEIKSCRFIRERCAFVRWDGKVSPCMGLLHNHTTYLNGNERKIEAYRVGDVSRDDLLEVWNSEEYRAFREKVDAFDFSPCHACGGCNHLEANREDCFGSSFPACGGCLWAQGVIQCP